VLLYTTRRKWSSAAESHRACLRVGQVSSLADSPTLL